MTSLLPSGSEYFVKSVLSLVAVVFMLGAAGLVLLQVLHQRSPSAIVPPLAKNYLDALAVNDYFSAYAMLTTTARINCSLDEFRLAADTTPWTWSNLSVASIERDAMLLQYDWKAAGRPARRDWLLFVDEQGSWRRPYNRPALLRATAALARKDTELALISAQQAVSTDPRDSAARAALCAAERALKLGEFAERDCAAASELAKRYPLATR